MVKKDNGIFNLLAYEYRKNDVTQKLGVRTVSTALK